MPRELLDQSTTPSATKPGEIFYADVLRRSRQHILVTRDVHSSYTTSSIVPDETAESLRNGLVINTCNIRASSSAVYVDTAPGFQSLKDDALLKRYGITIEYGRVKNKNAVAVADKGIQELEREMLNVDPSGGPLSEVQLQLVVETLNTRIRNRGLSSREILFQRDQHTNNQLNINDITLAEQQSSIREKNHLPSARSKARGNPRAEQQNLNVGNLVFIKGEGSKNQARDRYIITKIEGSYAIVQKLGTQFMSRQYKIPLNQLYLATKSSSINQYHDWDRRHTTTDTSDTDYTCESSDTDNASVNAETDVEADDETEAEPVEAPAAAAADPPMRNRPPRMRQPPAWQRSGDYDMQT